MDTIFWLMIYFRPALPPLPTITSHFYNNNTSWDWFIKNLPPKSWYVKKKPAPHHEDKRMLCLIMSMVKVLNLHHIMKTKGCSVSSWAWWKFWICTMKSCTDCVFYHCPEKRLILKTHWSSICYWVFSPLFWSTETETVSYLSAPTLWNRDRESEETERNRDRNGNT